jgi:hypothetical protein
VESGDDRARRFRRDVAWLEGHEAPIAPLLGWLDFSAGFPNWGYRPGFRLVAISERDLRVIAAAMAADLPPFSEGEEAIRP